jgi:hypothetical protein
MGPVLERVREGELWLADRNFSTSRILRAVHEVSGLPMEGRVG